MPNIAETAKDAGQFSTLLAAVEAAGLADALTGDASLTVFAPTDEAFNKLPEGTVEGLLQDIPKLKSILTYHVVEGNVLAADVVKLESAKTLNGADLAIQAGASRPSMHAHFVGDPSGEKPRREATEGSHREDI